MAPTAQQQHVQPGILEAPAVGEPSTCLGIQQEVVWLDVPVDKSQLVNGIDGQHCLRNVKLGLLL